RVGDLGDTGADESVEADNLAGPYDDVDIVVVPSSAEAEKFESGLVLGVDLPLVLGFAQDAANHELDDLAHRQLLDRVRADGLPVPHDEHILGDTEQLVEAMGNVDHRDSRFGEPPNDAEQDLDFSVSEDGGRLVEDQDVR